MTHSFSNFLPGLLQGVQVLRAQLVSHVVQLVVVRGARPGAGGSGGRAARSDPQAEGAGGTAAEGP